ncbi:nicotinamide-nucleotide adenylyltransferase [Vibrio phage D480]
MPNDNENKGLPADIDLVESAIKALKRKPNDIRRSRHLNSVMQRVGNQIDTKIGELMQYNHVGVIGKFHNYHQGHFKLIKHALELGKTVTVFLCQEDDDPVPTYKRVGWMYGDFGRRINIEVIQPSSHNLSNKSESDRQVSKEWAKFFDDNYPEVEAFVGSEQYIMYCAEYGNFDGVMYDEARTITPCSSTQVRKQNQHEFYSPAAQQDRVTKIAFIGPESSGKSVTAELICEANGFELITEQARDMMDDTFYTMQDLNEFAAAQNVEIVKSGKQSDVVIADSSAVTTAMYAKQTFGEVPNTLGALAAFEDIDAYVLFSPFKFVQDGTRVQTEQQRNEWFYNAQQFLLNSNKPFLYVRKGNTWDERAQEAAQAVSLLKHKVQNDVA